MAFTPPGYAPATNPIIQMAYDLMQSQPGLTLDAALQTIQQYFGGQQQAPAAPTGNAGADQLMESIRLIMRTYGVDQDTAASILRGETKAPVAPGSPEELNKAIDDISRTYGVGRDVAAKMLRGEVPYPQDGNQYRPPAPPGYAWAFDPAQGTYNLVDTTPLDMSQPLAGWSWVLNDPKDPASGHWVFFPNPDILQDPYKGVPPAVIPWLQKSLESGGDLSVVPEGPARSWVQFLMAQAGRERQPGTVPFGLGIPGFGTPDQPLPSATGGGAQGQPVGAPTAPAMPVGQTPQTVPQTPAPLTDPNQQMGVPRGTTVTPLPNQPAQPGVPQTVAPYDPNHSQVPAMPGLGNAPGGILQPPPPPGSQPVSGIIPNAPGNTADALTYRAGPGVVVGGPSLTQEEANQRMQELLHFFNFGPGTSGTGVVGTPNNPNGLPSPGFNQPPTDMNNLNKYFSH